MGAITSAFNQAAGAVAGAAVAIKHTKEKEFNEAMSAQDHAIVAQGQAQNATDEANAAYHKAQEPDGLIEQLSNAEVTKEYADKAYEKAKNRKNASPVTVFERMTAAQAADKAFRKLKDEYDSVVGMMDRAAVMRNQAIQATELAVKKTNKYKTRWGGIR